MVTMPGRFPKTVPNRDINRVIAAVAKPGIRSAICFIGPLDELPRLRVKATRQLGLDKRYHTDEILLTIGKPNYEERTYARNRILCIGRTPKLWLRRYQP